MKTLETVDELTDYLTSLLRNDFRSGLADRATAWSMMRVNGEPPLGTGFARTIATDLAEYGFAILRAALQLIEKDGDKQLARNAFNAAGKAFENLVRNTYEEDSHVGFFRVIAGASYHLAGYSAIAYSILNKRLRQGENNAPCEIALIYLILRDLDSLRSTIREWLTGSTDDATLAQLLSENEYDLEDAISDILNNSICRGLAFFDLALASGNEELFAQAKRFFRQAEKLAADSSTVTLWWIAKLTANLTDDLWQNTLHVRMPIVPPPGGEENYPALRELFISQLYARKVAEVELWPSQLEASERCGDVTDNLIVALPTSAGKTRIAELAALVTLSTEKRVLIVTPLRALSAQTERSFRKTFTPLGFSVSSLYGAGGLSALDSDALNNRHIVIATPEKLDFALRNDASILDDIGLIVLDEGHMIGKSEREIRFEILVQRLLKRADAAERRIVCLSAILPDGDNLSDLTEWMRNDKPGDPVKMGWRPTRQLFGTLEWNGRSATLNYDHKREQPFILDFVRKGAPEGQDAQRPSSMHDLTMYSAWAFARQGKKTLVFVTQANWVENFGKKALDLFRKGYLPSLLKNANQISRCVAVGKEWLGAAHPAVKCLEIGVALHHGNLPDPFLRELEMLIATNVITVTVASPTLSQGLNINAAVLLVPYLTRAGEELKGEEFANVAGRAGRAFVDVEGLVLHIIYDRHDYRKGVWNRVVASARHRLLISGLMQVIQQAMDKLANGGVLQKEDAYEYLANSREAWFTKSNGQPANELAELESDVDKLDAIILSLIESLDSEADDLPTLLEEALRGSFWERQIERQSAKYRKDQLELLNVRARLIWANTTAQRRKEHFCMGVGLDTGLMLDAIADELNEALDTADLAALNGDADELNEALTMLAEALFTIQPFKPEMLIGHWKDLLYQWVRGISVDLIGPANVPQIEQLFAYRLVWAIEAIRMRRLAAGWEPESITGGAAACAENGVPNLMSALLIRAGLPSRRAAMLAVAKGNANFADRTGMREWLESETIEELSALDDWPSAETAPLWQAFREEVMKPELRKWRRRDFSQRLQFDQPQEIPGGYYRFEIDEDGTAWVTSPDFVRLAPFRRSVTETGRSLSYVLYEQGNSRANIVRFGEGRLIWD